MGGGHFNYDQYRIGEIAAEVDVYLGGRYSKETLDKFKEAVDTLRRAEIMANRIDWLLSTDDGEDTFNRRWYEELKELENK